MQTGAMRVREHPGGPGTDHVLQAWSETTLSQRDRFLLGCCIHFYSTDKKDSYFQAWDSDT